MKECKARGTVPARTSNQVLAASAKTTSAGKETAKRRKAWPEGA